MGLENPKSLKYLTITKNNIHTMVINIAKQRMLWKTLINDLTFCMFQHTSSDVTVG